MAKLCMCAHRVQWCHDSPEEEKNNYSGRDRERRNVNSSFLHIVPYCLQSTFICTRASHPCNSPEGDHIIASSFYMEEMKVQGYEATCPRLLLRGDRDESQAPRF